MDNLVTLIWTAEPDGVTDHEVANKLAKKVLKALRTEKRP